MTTAAPKKAKQHGADATEQLPVTHHRTTKVEGRERLLSRGRPA